MVFLLDEENHGYALVADLPQFGFSADTLDPSLVYRALREMENDGWLQSRWSDESLGPKRRLYRLTNLGKEQLTNFINDLRRTREEIEVLIHRYEKL